MILYNVRAAQLCRELIMTNKDILKRKYKNVKWYRKSTKLQIYLPIISMCHHHKCKTFINLLHLQKFELERKDEGMTNRKWCEYESGWWSDKVLDADRGEWERREEFYTFHIRYLQRFWKCTILAFNIICLNTTEIYF